MLDAYGNHVDKGLEVQLNVDGFSFQDRKGSIRKVSAIFQLVTHGHNVVLLYGKLASFQPFFFFFWHNIVSKKHEKLKALLVFNIPF